MSKHEGISLSYFEAVLHRRHRATLSSEIADCFKYFEDNSPSKKAFGDEQMSLIHNNRLTLRRVTEGKGYSVEIDGVVRVVGVDPIPRTEQLEIVGMIRNVTIPYAQHVAKKLYR